MKRQTEKVIEALLVGIVLEGINIAIDIYKDMEKEKNKRKAQ